MNSGWITDRRPTIKDADENGTLWVHYAESTQKAHFKSHMAQLSSQPWFPRVKRHAPADYIEPETQEQKTARRLEEAKATLPEGYVFLGQGRTFKTNGLFRCKTYFLTDDSSWEAERHKLPRDGDALGLAYAVLENGPTARLNGLGATYWSKPSHFPPVCWIMPKANGGCYLTSSPSNTLRFNIIKELRWRDRPFDNYEDGLPCTLESTQQNES